MSEPTQALPLDITRCTAARRSAASRFGIDSNRLRPPRFARQPSAVSYSPLNKDELVADTLARELVLKVVDGPPALLLGEVGDKLLKVARLGRLEDNDALLVVRDAVDDVGELLARLQLLVLLETLLDLLVVITMSVVWLGART